MEPNVWRKSGRSGSNGQCVEVRDDGDSVAVRDSKNQAGPVLTFPPDEWRRFIHATKDGEFDAGQNKVSSSRTTPRSAS